jgi:hypothetical protein
MGFDPPTAPWLQVSAAAMFMINLVLDGILLYDSKKKRL